MRGYVLGELSRRGLGPAYEIYVRDLVVSARLGVHDHERRGPQRVRIDVRLWVEDRPGADDLESVVDYDFVRRRIAAILAEGPVALQETLVRRILERVMAPDAVLAAEVSTTKLDVYDDAEVGCRMHRIRAPQ